MATQDSVTRRDFLGRTVTLGASGLLGSQLLARSTHAAPADCKSTYRVGIYTRPWDRFDYRTALDAMAEAGFKHAGLMTTTTEGRRLVIQADLTTDQCAKIGQEVKSRGMTIPSVYGGGIRVNKSLETGIEDLKRLIDKRTRSLHGGTPAPSQHIRLLSDEGPQIGTNEHPHRGCECVTDGEVGHLSRRPGSVAVRMANLPRR